jgi:hypothetical protein
MDIREQDKSHTHANENQPSCLGDVSGSYVVFEESYEQDGLVQLSVTIPTLEEAREFVKDCQSHANIFTKELYIYLLVE